MSKTETKTGRELEPARMRTASPKQRRAAQWFLGTLSNLLGEDHPYD